MKPQFLNQSANPLVKEVGAFIRNNPNTFKGSAIDLKSENQLVSYIDFIAEKQLVEGLAELTPKAGFVTQEEIITKKRHTQVVWIANRLKSKLPVAILILSLFLICCNPAAEQKNQQHPAQPKVFRKNPGIHSDTLKFNLPCAVFFYPDSLQLAGYKVFVPESFESSEHEYLSQMNNARNVLKGNWPHVEIVNCKNAKFLIPHDYREKDLPLNLDEINDLWGLILFERGKIPAHVDMMNIETGLENYFIR